MEKHLSPTVKRKTDARLSRRQVLAGGVAASVLSGLQFSTAQGFAMTGSIRKARKPCEPTLAKYLCDAVHEPMSHKLDQVILDPSIDWRATKETLDDAVCPGCGGRVYPAHEHLAIVMPGGKTVPVEGSIG